MEPISRVLNDHELVEGGVSSYHQFILRALWPDNRVFGNRLLSTIIGFAWQTTGLGLGKGRSLSIKDELEQRAHQSISNVSTEFVQKSNDNLPHRLSDLVNNVVEGMLNFKFLINILNRLSKLNFLY